MLTKGKFMFSKLFSSASTLFSGSKVQENTTQKSFTEAGINHAYAACGAFFKAILNFAQFAAYVCPWAVSVFKGVPDQEAGTKAAKYLAEAIVDTIIGGCHTIAAVLDGTVVLADLMVSAGEKAAPVVYDVANSAKSMFDSTPDDEAICLNDISNVLFSSSFDNDDEAVELEGDIYHTPSEY